MIMCSISILYIIPFLSYNKSDKIEEIADRMLSLGNQLRNCPYYHIQTILKIAWKNVHTIYIYPNAA